MSWQGIKRRSHLTKNDLVSDKQSSDNPAGLELQVVFGFQSRCQPQPLDLPACPPYLYPSNDNQLNGQWRSSNPQHRLQGWPSLPSHVTSTSSWAQPEPPAWCGSHCYYVSILARELLKMANRVGRGAQQNYMFSRQVVCGSTSTQMHRLERRGTSSNS